MNSLTSLTLNIAAEPIYVQLVLTEELRLLEAEISQLSLTHFPPGSQQYTQLAFGLLEMGVYDFGMQKGASLSPALFNIGLVKRSISLKDQRDVSVDIAAALHRQLAELLPKGFPEHRFGFRLLGNGNVLVALDPRDMEPLIGEDKATMDAVREVEEPGSSKHGTDSFG